jgi:N-acetylmuramoyl-L-alanine amidase
MRIARSSAPCAVPDGACVAPRSVTARSGRRWFDSATAVVTRFRVLLATALISSALTVLAAPLAAQTPVLRIAAGSAVDVRGATATGAAAFPARALEVLGFRIVDNAAGVSAVLGADTLHFWATSPYFRAGRRMHQLAFATSVHAGALHLPEQFFIQWLPTAYPDRFAYRSGSLVVLTGSTATLAAQPRSTATAASRTAPKPRVVVIDPGHGGRDPGKIGPNGLAEKDVTLMISQRVAGILRERGYEVHLTRTTDRYVSLPDRPRMANEWRGDRPVGVFLSIHANSAPSTAVRGFETFFLSEARTDDERRVAEMENEAIRFDEHHANGQEDGLAHILNTLRSDFLMRASHDLAAVLQDRMSAFHPGPNRGVKRAGFYVLVGAIMPAVLIETAFISNREEARLLGTQSFQQKIAWGIADSVDEFFRRNEHLWEQEP